MYGDDKVCKTGSFSLLLYYSLTSDRLFLFLFLDMDSTVSEPFIHGLGKLSSSVGIERNGYHYSVGINTKLFDVKA